MKFTIDFNSPQEALNFIIATGQNITGISPSGIFTNDIPIDNASVEESIYRAAQHHTAGMEKRTPAKSSIMKQLKRKTYDSFVWKNRLYFRIGEFYGWLSTDNDFTPIVSSCFYSNKKKANTHVV